MKIYLACGLTHVPDIFFKAYTERIHSIAVELKDLGYEVKYALVDSDPQLASESREDQARLCYEWDRSMVLWADCIIAEASFPSTGMGIELEIANQKNIPIIICFSTNEFYQSKKKNYFNPDRKEYQLQIGEGFVSLMALGVPAVVQIICYRNTHDLNRQLLEALETGI